MRLTPLGAAFLGFGAIATAVGVVLGALSLGLFGLLLLGCLGWAVAGARAPHIQVERRILSEVAQEGAAVAVEVAVRVLGGTGRWEAEEVLPPELAFSGRASRLALPTRGEVRFGYAIRGLVPGKFAPGPLRVRHRDPLGLVEHVHDVEGASAQKVLPRAEDLRTVPVSSRASMLMSGPHLVGQAGSGSDFYALREFQQGDAIRDVNWRASARGGKLVVNQREKESQARVTFFLDNRAVAVVGTRGTNARVLQLRALATLAAAAARRKDRARVVLWGGGEPASLDASPADPGLLGLLGDLVERAPRGEGALAEAVRQAVPALRPRAPAVLLTSLLDDDTVPEAIGTLRALEQDVLLVAVRGPELLRLSGEPASAVAAARVRHERLLAAARAQGALVLDWDPTEPLALALLREAST